jgi:hypothetical protein
MDMKCNEMSENTPYTMDGIKNTIFKTIPDWQNSETLLSTLKCW